MLLPLLNKHRRQQSAPRQVPSSSYNATCMTTMRMTMMILLLLMLVTCTTAFDLLQPWEISWVEPLNTNLGGGQSKDAATIEVMDMKSLPWSDNDFIVAGLVRNTTQLLLGASPLSHNILDPSLLTTGGSLNFVSLITGDSGLSVWTRLYATNNGVITIAIPDMVENTVDRNTSGVVVAGSEFVQELFAGNGSVRFHSATLGEHFQESCTDLVTGAVHLVGVKKYADGQASIIVSKVQDNQVLRVVISTKATGGDWSIRSIAVSGDSIFMSTTVPYQPGVIPPSLGGQTLSGSRLLLYNLRTEAAENVVTGYSHILTVSNHTGTPTMFGMEVNGRTLVYRGIGEGSTMVTKDFSTPAILSISGLDSFAAEQGEVLIVSGTLASGSATILEDAYISTNGVIPKAFVCVFIFRDHDVASFTNVMCNELDGQSARAMSVSESGDILMAFNSNENAKDMTIGDDPKELKLPNEHTSWMGMYTQHAFLSPRLIISHDISFHPIKFEKQHYLINRPIKVTLDLTIEDPQTTLLFSDDGQLIVINSTVTFGGTSSSPVEIECLNISPQQRIVLNWNSTIRLTHVLVKGREVSLLSLDGGRVMMDHVEFEEAGGRAILAIGPGFAQIDACIFDAAHSPVEPIVSIIESVDYPGRLQDISITNNRFIGGVAGLDVAANSGELIIRHNTFSLIDNPLKVTTYGNMLTAIDDNTISECSGPLTIVKKSEGRFYVRNNTLIQNTADTAFKFDNSFFCSEPTLISGNNFSGNDVTTQVVSIKIPTYCTDSDFRKNNLTGNTIATGGSLITVQGTMRVNRNILQFHEASLKYSGSKAINAQFNYWGTSDAASVRRISGNTGTVPRTIKTLYTPFLDNNMAVQEDDTLFSSAELESLADCKSIRALWPAAISGVYRIKPLCESMLANCRIDSFEQSIVFQRREFGDIDFDVAFETYKVGFGELDGDFFWGLEKIALINRLADYVYVQYKNPQFSTTDPGFMSIDHLNPSYPLSITTNSFEYENVPFVAPTGSPRSDLDYLGCAQKYNSGWWFGNCTDPKSWRLNGMVHPDLTSDNYVNGIDNVISSNIRLDAAYADRDLLVCANRKCFGKDQNDALVCSGHGLCRDTDVCVCSKGYGGTKCEIPVSFDLTIIPPEKFCVDDFVIVTKVIGLTGPFIYDWTVSFNVDLSPEVDDILASHRNNATLVIPGRLLSINNNVLRLQIFHNDIRIGEAYPLIYTPLPDLTVDNIDVPPLIIVQQYESFSVVLRAKDLPKCADTAPKKWRVNGMQYETISNEYILHFEASYSWTINVELAVNGSMVKKDIIVVVIPAITHLRIAGGSRMVSAYHNHTIDASQSYDRTVPKDSVPRFYWNCTNCRYFNPDFGSKQIFYEAKGVYVLKVLYYPDPRTPYRNASADITLTVIDDMSDMPIPEMGTILPSVLDARKKLRIQPIVHRNRPEDYLEYIWTVLRVEANETTTIAGTSFNPVPLVLPEGFLKPSSSYVFTFRVKYTNFTNYGEAFAVARTASAPIVRATKCSPCRGTALRTKFSFSVEAVDHVEYYPLQYSFSYWDSYANMYVPLQMTSYFPSVTVLLPDLKLPWVIIQAVTTNYYGVESKSTLNITLIEPDNIPDIIQGLIDQVNSGYSSDKFTTIAGSLSSMGLGNETDGFAEQLMLSMSTILDVETDNATLSVDSAVVNINTIEILSGIGLYSNESTITNSTYQLLDRLIDLCVNGSLELLDPAVNSLARSVANLMIKYQTEAPHEPNPMISSVSKLTSLISSQMFTSENQTLITTDTYQLSIKKENSDSIRGIDMHTNDVRVNIPRNLSLPVDGDLIVQSISFNYTFNPYETDMLNFSTPVLDFMIRQGEEKIKLSHMAHPLVIVLNKEVQKENSSYKYQCRFMDETTNSSWLTKGCRLHSEDEETITCHCDHTTSFSAMIIFDPKAPNKASDGLYITSIIINVLFALICIVLLVMCFIWRRKQPIKSRFLAPYIGLGAVLIECILNGIIRNSLLIAANNVKQFKAVNSIAYLILTIVNPLVLLSLFIYFWQMLRYFFLKHLYAIMDVEKSNRKKIHLLKFISSKVVYVVLGLVIYVLACAYFVVISILEATNVIKPNPASTVNALSFSLMSLVFGALIVATFLWDLSIILTRKLLRKDNKKVSEGMAEMQYLKKLGQTFVNHFRSDDPLVFRIESIFMVLAILVMTVSYIVGITDRFDKRARPNSAAKIIEFLFDILYLSLRIMAFGGLAVLVRLIQRFKLHKQNEEYETLKQLMSNLKTGTSTIESQLQDMLRDEYGYRAISTYAKKEFALENVILWKRLEEVRTFNILATPDTRKQSLEALYQDCIATGSPFECNLPHRTKKNLEKLLKAPNEEVEASNTEEVLLAISNEVMVNICDTYTRFSTSPEYAQYLKVRQLGIELSTVGDLSLQKKNE